MIRLSLAIALLASPVGAIAQQESNAAKQAETGQPVKRIRNVQLQRGERCPPAQSADEIVVCGTLGEPYRIPKDLRDSEPAAVQQSWANRASQIDDVSREAAGLPNTCSPVGSGGQTGCVSKQLRQYADDKRAQRAEEARTP